jgi:LysM repeat protein
VNSLKPLLVVAVLAGVGYGVYVRLNAGAGAPPPPVSPGWDAVPDVQMPGQPSSPWDATASAAPTAPDAQMVPGQPPPSQAPPYQGPAPGAVPGSAAPPFAPGPEPAPPAGAAPPVEYQGPPPEAIAGGAPPAAQSGTPATPYEYLPPHDTGAAPDAAAAAPPYDPATNDPYASAPAGNAGDPFSAAPAGQPTDSAAPPAAGVAPSEAYPPSEPYPPAGAAPPGGEIPPASQTAVGGTVAAALDSAHRELEAGQLASALRQLSAWYDHPQLTPPEQNELNALLDQVAGTVVYSTQNLLEPPYEVQPGETLQDIGEKYHVPWQLLAKINGIDDPAALRGGERLKVVRGPFQAVVNLNKRELALMTHDGLYAGRFRVGLGSDQPPQEGTFAVSEKMVNPVYHGRGRAIGAEDPTNPLGERWIGLGKQMAIHGTNDPGNIGRADLPGSISLSERDAADVFDILSLGSRVTVRR